MQRINLRKGASKIFKRTTIIGGCMLVIVDSIMASSVPGDSLHI